VHEGIGAVDVHAHVSRPVARRAPDSNVPRDFIVVVDDYEARLVLEHLEQASADVVLLVGIGCTSCLHGVAVSHDVRLRERQSKIVWPCALQEAPGVVVVEVGQHHEADIAGRHAGMGERSLRVRSEPLEGPP